MLNYILVQDPSHHESLVTACLMTSSAALFLFNSCNRYAALVEPDAEADPLSSADRQWLLEDHRRLLPVRVLTEGADALLGVQMDLVPEGNGSHLA